MLTNTTTSMFFSVGEKHEDMPYIVVTWVSMIPTYIMGELTRPLEELRMQFTVYDKTATSIAIDAIMDQIEAAYGLNGSALSFEDNTYTHVESFRVMGPLRDRANGVWQSILDYRIILKKAA